MKKPKEKTQKKKFIDIAKELECDEDEKSFDEALGSIAKSKSEVGKPNK